MKAKVLVGIGLALVVVVFAVSQYTAEKDRPTPAAMAEIKKAEAARNKAEAEGSENKKKQEKCQKDYEELLKKLNAANTTWFMGQIKKKDALFLIRSADELQDRCPGYAQNLMKFKDDIEKNKD